MITVYIQMRLYSVPASYDVKRSLPPAKEVQRRKRMVFGRRLGHQKSKVPALNIVIYQVPIAFIFV
jgi:hypothetical protein